MDISQAPPPSQKIPPATRRSYAPGRVDEIPVDGLPVPLRYLALAAVLLGISMTTLDGGIANVALPSIARELHTSGSAAVWVVNGYQLPLVMLLLPLSSLGERYGYRRLFSLGLAVFTLASLACALSHTLPLLVTARVVQGAGAGAMMSVSSALVRTIYPARMLGRGVGINAMVISVAAAAGPTVAAAILSVAPWEWLFAINVPLGVVALGMAARLLPANELTVRAFDWRSAALNALCFGLAILGVDGLGRAQPLAVVGAQFAGALLAGALLVRRELPRPAPLFPLDLLRIPMFRLSVITSVCSFTAQMLAFVSLPFYFQNSLGMSEIETGLLMTPWPLAVGVAAPLAGWLSDRMPAGILGSAGMLVNALGLVLLALLPAHPSHLELVLCMAVCGAGFGTFQSPNNRAMLSSAPRTRSGGAGGMLATARLLGQTTGTALVALILALAAAHGTVLSLACAAGFATLAAAVSCLRLVRPEARVPRPPGPRPLPHADSHAG
jgi:MFS transporter, DHA2 family, multidrug resistance protein